MIDPKHRHQSWGLVLLELRMEQMAAELAYQGASLTQMSRCVEKKVAKHQLVRFFNMLSPTRRGLTGRARNGGRPNTMRTIARFSFTRKALLIRLLIEWNRAVIAGADVAESLLAVWVVNHPQPGPESQVEADQYVTLDIWLKFSAMVQQRRICVAKCTKCGTPNLVLDLMSGHCAGGRHPFVDGGAYLYGENGTESPILTKPLK